MTPLEGLDVASIQGDIDWAAVRAAGYRWCYIRLTRGVAEVDTHALRNYAGCLDNGIIPGFYHRAFPGSNSPESEAEHFAAHLPRTYLGGPVLLPPCLDYEDKVPGQGWAQNFLARVRALSGRRKAMLYAPGSWFDSYLGGESWMDDDVWLWVADSGRYTGATKGRPKYLTPRVVAHQYGQSREVPGLNGVLCDLDVTTGDLLALAGR